jgi:hypothetical protein
MHHRRALKRPDLLISAALAWFLMAPDAWGNPPKEFLTEKEIEQIQIAQEIHLRVKLYMEYAAARLAAAEDRLNGKESPEGDPFEFFSPEDMIDGYYRILSSVMITLDDAYQRADSVDLEYVKKALKSLKGSTENAAKRLDVLKRIAEEKQKEELWNLVNKAMDITKGAREGADYGLSMHPDPPEKRPPKK